MQPSFAQFLPPWMARQRWYVGKGSEPVLRRIGGLRWQDPDGEVGLETWFLADDAGDRRTVYQVPLSYRSTPLPGAERALVATAQHSELGTRYVYDACHDPVFAGALVATLLGQGSVASDGAGEHGTATGHRHPGTPQAVGGVVRSSRVLHGEQSNTSIIVELGSDNPGSDDPGPAAVIVKLFRVLQDGLNPDIVLHEALARAGSVLVPRLVGWLSGRWPDPTSPTGTADGHLAFAEEYFADVQDGWRVALAAVAAGEDFADRAGALGRTTATLHATLAAALPTAVADPGAIEAIAATMRERLVAAVAEVPTLGDDALRATRVLAAAACHPWPRLQRVHGDYHLGQVLDVPGRGWILLDFEGEPLRPLAERSAPDVALRDVAGMLRSFDYAARSWERERPGASADGWLRSARQAFLAGYAAVAGAMTAPQSVLLRALELEKALYEVVYEARHRPSWSAIPIQAVQRLCSADPDPA
jgi:predicted trehalose synthase